MKLASKARKAVSWFAGRSGIAILDDAFPHPLSAFRYEEFVSYLDAIPGVSIYTTGHAFSAMGEARSRDEVLATHLAHNPAHRGRVKPLKRFLPAADLYYAMFLANICQFVGAIEHRGKPFAFTLYPGGGFQYGVPASDAQLDRVLSSPCFHHVIVSQRNTRDYLLARSVPPSKITYIHGGPVPREAFSAVEGKLRYGFGKAKMDIGFIANRYTPTGADKGYDLFVETADALARHGIDATYHVVGPWDETIVPAKEAAGRFVFHGFLLTEPLRRLSATLDLVLSPNRSNVLRNASFDGFPTGSCVEAGLQEAVLVCSDDLEQNAFFRDGHDMVFVEPRLDAILEKLLPLARDPHVMATLGTNARQTIVKHYGWQAQIEPRLALLTALKNTAHRRS